MSENISHKFVSLFFVCFVFLCMIASISLDIKFCKCFVSFVISCSRKIKSKILLQTFDTKDKPKTKTLTIKSDQIQKAHHRLKISILLECKEYHQ